MSYKCDNCNMSVTFVTVDYQDRIDDLDKDLVTCCSYYSKDKKKVNTDNESKPDYSKSSSTKLFIDKSELSNNS